MDMEIENKENMKNKNRNAGSEFNSSSMTDGQKIFRIDEKDLNDDPDETELLFGSKGSWYILDVAESITDEEKKFINGLPNVDIDKLIHLRHVYIEQNLRSKKEIIYYKKKLTEGKENKREDPLIHLTGSISKRLHIAREATTKSAFFIHIIEGAIIKNKAFQEYDEEKNSLLKQIKDKDQQYTEINRELMNAHALIKKQQRKLKLPDLSREEFRAIVEKCRKQNGKINYTKIGNEIGTTHHTAKKYCQEYGIRD